MKDNATRSFLCGGLSAALIFFGSASAWFGTLRVSPHSAGRWHGSSDFIGSVILDRLFSLPYYLTNAAGLWQPGPSWIESSPFLALLCYLLWPITCAALIAAFAGWLSHRWWRYSTPIYRVAAAVVPVAIVLTFSVVQGTLGQDDFSYFRYSFENW